MVKFNWEHYLGTALETKAHLVLVWAKQTLAKTVFPRSDYRELVELVIVYLGGVVPSFKFRKPKLVSSARFMQRAIYYITMQLLSSQVNI